MTQRESDGMKEVAHQPVVFLLAYQRRYRRGKMFMYRITDSQSPSIRATPPRAVSNLG